MVPEKCSALNCQLDPVKGVRLCMKHWREALPNLLERTRTSEATRPDAGLGLVEEPEPLEIDKDLIEKLRIEDLHWRR